ncbi:MAG: MotA/TolQ/ExbB proton channel family protein [Spirochaetaceae bacterium]|nr:MotA/TolQ/ExbB proton channel family protein [Spirochaetaceae bacterium]MBO7484945.1 MotA/TolQ/ExbB proton channel family protein [Spirochaetaceae bacterium]MBP5328285.1 MotA/TolQ/ExbB proton channel family protein [Spirochaetaceae bacterium]
MYDFLATGGFMMIPILICAVLALYIIIDRLRYFGTITKKDGELIKHVNAMIERRDFEHADFTCGQAATPCAMVMQKTIQFRNYPDTDVKDAVNTEINRQLPELEHFLTALATIANISTLLGLLGTVLGTIDAFQVLTAGNAALNQPQLVQAFAKSLITTAAGLFVSIPSTLFYNCFVMIVNKNIAKMESLSSDIMIRLSGRGKLL